MKFSTCVEKWLSLCNGSFPGMWISHAPTLISPVMTSLWHLPLQYVKALNTVEQVHLKVISPYSAHTSSPRLSWTHSSPAVVSQRKLKTVLELTKTVQSVHCRSCLIKNYNMNCKVGLAYNPQLESLHSSNPPMNNRTADRGSWLQAFVALPSHSKHFLGCFYRGKKVLEQLPQCYLEGESRLLSFLTF